MKLRDILDLISRVSEDIDTSSFLCGGTPRDKLLNLLDKGIGDLDVTTGNKSIHILAKTIAMELGKQFSIDSKTAEDGHTSLYLGDFKLDFSSNFVDPSVVNALAKLGISNPTDMQKEMYSRDFTCNTLLMSLDLKTITDPTNLGIDDIHKRLIKTCLDPNITLGSNPNRIIRVIYLASKLDFDVDPTIIKWMSSNREIIRASNDNYLIKNIDKAMARNPERAAHIINQTGLWDYLPMTEELKAYRGKTSIAMQKTARRQDDIETLKNNIGNYIHFSNSDRFGISFHKDIHPGNPRAAYGFPLTQQVFNRIANGKPNTFEDYGYHQYIYVFNVSGNILNLDSFNPYDIAKSIKSFIKQQYNVGPDFFDQGLIKDIKPSQMRGDNDGQKLFSWMSHVARELRHAKFVINEHSAANIMLRAAGLDAIKTDHHGFGDDIASEIAVLNPNSINLIAKITNPMLSRDDLKEIDRMKDPEYVKRETEKFKAQMEVERVERRKELEEQLNKEYAARKTAQWRRNYDLGEGLYSNLDKYKSVQDFRRKRRKKRMKEIKRLKDMKLK